MCAPAAAAGMLMIVPTLTSLTAQSEPARPQNPPAAHGAKPADANQIELFEDRSFVLVGRVLKKEGQMFLRIKALPGMAPGEELKPAAGDAKDVPSKSAAAAGEQAGGEPQKRKSGQRRMLQLNEDVQLLKSAMLEDIEEDAGLKDMGGKTDIEATPLIQVQGILTMYRNEPYLFVQSYRTRTEKDSSRHDEKKD
jgi:hypothetical protein